MTTSPIVEAYSVSQILRYLKEMVESEKDLADVWVKGEIADAKLALSGHCYFTLKDEHAAIRCVIWRNSNLAPVKSGMQVFLHGRFMVYEQRGELQMIADRYEDMGVGILYQRFQALREELDGMGLLDPARRRQLPPMPHVVGIVTSANAAALRDILRTFRLRWPMARLILAPTLVQGTEAPGQIVQAIRALNSHAEAEVIIVARGGGSMEDLWAFNEREVALAIAQSAIPIVTGIGHETDFTIADFVADHRAATPTAAAAACTPEHIVFRAAVAGQRERLQILLQDRLEQWYDEVAAAQQRLIREHPRAIYDRARQQIDDLVETMRMRVTNRLAIDQERLSGAALRLQSLSPLLTIARGYGFVTRDHDEHAVTTTADVQPEDTITVRLRDGNIGATVTQIRPQT